MDNLPVEVKFAIWNVRATRRDIEGRGDKVPSALPDELADVEAYHALAVRRSLRLVQGGLV